MRSRNELITTEIIMEKDIDRWNNDKGDEILRLDYQLNENSLVLDLGGHVGKFASEVYSIYHCRILVFEPVKEYHEYLSWKFRANNNIKIYPFGLGPRTEQLLIELAGNESSIVRRSQEGPKEVIRIESIDRFFIDNIESVDLMKINIEGAEYELLDCLLDTPHIHKIKNIQIQFHDFLEYHIKWIYKLREKLQKTHHVTYSYDLIWENWKLNDSI